MLTLDQIVNSYMSQFERPSGEYRRLYDLALRGYKFCDLHSCAIPETVELDVLANKTAVLPATCIAGGVIEVGWQDEDGIIIPLTENKYISTLNSTSTTRVSATPAVPKTSVTTLGVGDRVQLGYSYKVDYENSIIVLDYDFPESTIVVKHMKMFEEQSEDYVVNDYFEECLISWILWQDSKRAKSTNADRQQNKKDFDTDLANARKSINGFSLRELFESYKRKLSLGNNVI